MSRWARELALGARLALAGGRGGWTRVAMTAVGVGLGVALLLFAASIPNVISARDDRGAARQDQQPGGSVKRNERSLLVAMVDTDFHGQEIRGRLVQPEGARAPVPPGVDRLPGPGELVASPRLARLLRSPAGALLRERLPYRVVGTIADDGLVGPGEYAYYAGSDELDSTSWSSGVLRIDHYGSGDGGDGFAPILWVLVVTAFAALLMPVAIFVGTATRFGGEQRDRRLAALRLVGADRRMTRRIAAGEALLGAVAGLAVGLVVFLVGRVAAERVTISDLSAFAGDIRPSAPLALAIAVGVPLAAVAVAQLALRGVAIEPLGVVRRAHPPRRRVLWRLLVPAAGALLLAPLVGSGGGDAPTAQLAVGVVLLLAGVVGLLPWLIERVVRHASGATVAWQLAIRRLQLDSAISARVVSGIAVAVAGAIALQTIFAAAEADQRRTTGVDLARAQAYVQFAADGEGAPASSPAAVAARLRSVPGVRSLTAVRTIDLSTRRARAQGDVVTTLTVGGCAALREFARVGDCADGDTFVVRGGGGQDSAFVALPGEGPRRGERVRLGPDEAAWTVPRRARRVPARAGLGASVAGVSVLATPAAVRAARAAGYRENQYLSLDRSDADAIERVRNVVARDPRLSVFTLAETRETRDFANVRRGIFAGAVAVLLLIGASMLVGALEQLNERRRALAALVAFGTPRATLTRSILWQTALPMALGLLLAIAVGVGLGALLIGITVEPVRIDVASIAALAGIGAAVVLLVTALSMPLLWRLMRPEGLRME